MRSANKTLFSSLSLQKQFDQSSSLFNNCDLVLFFKWNRLSFFESSNLKPMGCDGIVCLALIFSFYSHVVIQRLLYSNYSLVHQGPLAPLLSFPPLHVLCFPKALLIWILGVIKKSSWKHPIHLKFRFIWIFSQETLVECMPRDPKECKAFKLYIQADLKLVKNFAQLDLLATILHTKNT